jgi:hypothetical protein
MRHISHFMAFSYVDYSFSKITILLMNYSIMILMVTRQLKGVLSLIRFLMQIIEKIVFFWGLARED